MKKENVYVLCDTESKLERLKDIVSKHGDNVNDCQIIPRDGYIYLKYSTNCEYWWVGKKPSEDEKMKELSIDELDELLNSPQQYISKRIIFRMKKIIPLSSGITAGKYKSIQGIIQQEIQEFFNLKS